MNYKEKQINNILKKFNLGNAKEALEEISILIKKYPKIINYYLVYGKMCLQLNYLDEAERVFLFLQSKNKNSLFMYMERYFG